MSIKSRVSNRMASASAKATVRVYGLLSSTKGQGTTEYAILVGVLVVIAIAAVVAFRGKIQDLWTAIQEGVNKL